MLSKEKVAARGSQKNKQASLECLATPLKKKRGRKPRSPPPNPGPLSFFKVLIGDFKDVLFIPPMAACMLNELAKKYVDIEDVDGKSWKVKMSVVDGSLAFQNGWHDFVLAHSITVGEFILFSYTGELLFTARIFGTSAMERLDFQMKRRKGRCGKERFTTELKPANVSIEKRQNISQASKEKRKQTCTEVLRSLKRKKKSVKCDFSKIHVIESDSVSEGVVELSSAGEKPLYDSNSKESEIAHHDSEQTWHRNISQASKEKRKQTCTEVLRSLKRKKKSVKCDFSKIHVIESDSVSEGVVELSSAGEKPLYDSNSKESEIAHHDSEQTWHRNSDATVREQNVISPTELVNSDIEDIEAVASKSIRNRMSSTEKGSALLHSGGTSLSKQTAEEPDAMTKTATWAVNAHSDNKERLTEMSGSRVQMINGMVSLSNGKIEQGHSHDIKMFDSEPYDDKMESLSNLEHAECSPEIVFNLIKHEGVAKIFLSADGICHTTLDEKLIELATGASFNANEQEEPLLQNDHAIFGSETNDPCETFLVVPSNHVLDHTNDKKVNLMSITEEYGVPHSKGSSTIAESGLQSCNEVHECKYKSYPEIVEGNDWQSGISHDPFFDEDEKNVTPCSIRRCRVKIDRTDPVDIPSSSYFSFSVCLSDDVQSFLELQKSLACQLGKLKHDRKVVVLQDPSMRCWPVLYHQSNKFVGFIGGWVDFAEANNICTGDICEFELLNKMELKFRVQITKAEGSIFDEKAA